jgi:hypothetical protein
MFYGFLVICKMGMCMINAYADDPVKGLGFKTVEDCNKIVDVSIKLFKRGPNKDDSVENFYNYGCITLDNPVTDKDAFVKYIWAHYGPNVKKQEG